MTYICDYCQSYGAETVTEEGFCVHFECLGKMRNEIDAFKSPRHFAMIEDELPKTKHRGTTNIEPYLPGVAGNKPGQDQYTEA